MPVSPDLLKLYERGDQGQRNDKWNWSWHLADPAMQPVLTRWGGLPAELSIGNATVNKIACSMPADGTNIKQSGDT